MRPNAQLHNKCITLQDSRMPLQKSAKRLALWERDILIEENHELILVTTFINSNHALVKDFTHARAWRKGVVGRGFPLLVLTRNCSGQKPCQEYRCPWSWHSWV